MSNLVLTFIAEKEILLREFLLEKNISKKTLTRIKFDNDGSIKVNNKEENVRYKLSLGDVVQIMLPSENFTEHIRFFYDDFNVIYEDEYFLVVDKDSNLATIPSLNRDEKSLLEIVNGYFLKNNYKTIPHIVTRLDKNTTGLVIIAKHRHIHALFSKINIEKFYLALASGQTPKEVIIEKNIARANDSIILRTVSDDGKYAKTHLFTEEYFENINVSLIKLKLYTGRTHQIRVHSSFLGHSLLGDELYGGNKDFINRQALHCYNLKFIHPITNKELNIISEIPKDMLEVIN